MKSYFFDFFITKVLEVLLIQRYINHFNNDSKTLIFGRRKFFYALSKKSKYLKENNTYHILLGEEYAQLHKLLPTLDPCIPLIDQR